MSAGLLSLSSKSIRFVSSHPAGICHIYRQDSRSLLPPHSETKVLDNGHCPGVTQGSGMATFQHDCAGNHMPVSSPTTSHCCRRRSSRVVR